MSSGASEDIQFCKWALECPEKKEKLNKDVIIRSQNVQGKKKPVYTVELILVPGPYTAQFHLKWPRPVKQ